MIAKSFSALAVVALAAQAAADPTPYRPQVHKMSVRDLFGVARRQDSSGYQPSQAVCGTGSTCAEACGAGFETCASSDDMVHCYDAGTSQTCCPDNSGNSCDADYYCTADSKGDTWCCPDSMDLAACAAAYTIAGTLVSEAPKTTSTSSSSTSSSTSAPLLTTSTTSSSTSSFTKAAVASTHNNMTLVHIVVTDTVVVPCETSNPGASATFPARNTTMPTFAATGTPTQPAVTGPATAGANFVGAPAGALALLAGALAALL